MATIRELVTKWAFDIDDKPIKNVEAKFSNLTASVAQLGLGVAAAAGTIFGIVKTTANAGDEALKTSQKIGVNVEALQELQYAGSLADLSNDQLATGFKFLNKNMVEATKAGSEQAKVFNKLGVATKGADGKLRSADDVFTDVAKSFAKMPDGPEKTTAALEVFGKSGVDFIPLLNSGADSINKLRQEARDLNLVMSEDSAKASEAFNDSLTTAMAALTGVRNVVGSELIPQITELAKGFTEYVKVNRKLISQRIGDFLRGLTVFLQISVKFVASLADAVLGLSEALGGLEFILKMVAIAMAVFAAGKILFGIGSLILAVGALGNAFTIMQLKALAIPILIGAAVVAVGLIIEDIVSFFQGKDSVTGVIVEKFKAMFLSLQNGFNSLGSGAKIAMAVILTPLRLIINTFQNLLNIVDLVRGKLSFKEFGTKFMGNIASNLGMGTTDSLKGALGLGDSGSLASVAGVAPTPGQGVLAGANNSTNNANKQKNNINVSVEVNAGDRADAANIGQQVGNKTAGELDSVMRDTFRSFAGEAGAY